MSGDNGGCLAEDTELEQSENIKVTYIDSQSRDALGEIYYLGLEEVLIPDYDENKHDVYIRKVFASEPDTELWKIESQTIQNLSVIMTVSAQQSSTSLGLTAKSQSRAASQYFNRQKYQLVEVEFGVQQDVMTRSGRQGKNTSDSSALLPGDLYKMRPCIVHSCAGDRVKVIPLTSDGSRSDPKQLEINPGAFRGLSSRYSQKDSHALVDVLQTVSTFRVHPMRLRDGSFSNNFERNYLVEGDAKELSEMLAKIFGEDIYNENIRLKTRGETLLKEVKGIKDKRRELIELIAEKDSYIHTLETSLREFAQYVEVVDGIDKMSVEELLSKLSEFKA